MTSNTRYAISEKLLTIAFVYNGEIHTGLPYQWGREAPEGILIRELEVIEHHKVPNEWDLEGEKEYDGFVLKDAEGFIWHNQYPYASYGQVSDSGDRLFMVKAEDSSWLDALEAKGIPLEVTLASDVYGVIHRGIKEVSDEELREKLKNLLSTIDEILQTKFQCRMKEEPRCPSIPRIKLTRFVVAPLEVENENH